MGKATPVQVLKFRGGRSTVGRSMSMKNSNDTTGNRTHELVACSAVPQLTAKRHVPLYLNSEC